MMRAPILAVFALLAFAVIGADTPAERVDELVWASGTPEALRAALADHARAVAAESPDAAGTAWHLVGDSWARAGQTDSAVVALERAMAVREDDYDRFRLADLLLRRRNDGDVNRARTLLAGRLEPAGRGPQSLDREGLIGWAHVLAGHPDSALAAFGPYRRWIGDRPTWRYRLARAHFDAGDPRSAYTVLLPLAVASRREDGEVMDLLHRIGSLGGNSDKIDMAINQGVGDRDRADKAAIAGMGGERVYFPAPDGFGLGGVLVAPTGRGPARAAIVLAAPGDSIADYDSLAVALRNDGVAVLLLDVRGSGWSVGPSCPAMDTWEGREDRMLERVVRDVGSALTFLATRVNVDTTHFVVAGVGTTAPLAVAAAGDDPRVTALLLVSPRPEELERGPMRQVLATRKMPVFFQAGPEDGRDMPAIEALYEAGDRRVSRISDSRRIGTGIRQFNYEPEVVTRFLHWLDESLPPAGPRGPRPR